MASSIQNTGFGQTSATTGGPSDAEVEFQLAQTRCGGDITRSSTRCGTPTATTEDLQKAALVRNDPGLFQINGSQNAAVNFDKESFPNLDLTRVGLAPGKSGGEAELKAMKDGRLQDLTEAEKAELASGIEDTGRTARGAINVALGRDEDATLEATDAKALEGADFDKDGEISDQELGSLLYAGTLVKSPSRTPFLHSDLSFTREDLARMNENPSAVGGNAAAVHKALYE